MRTTPILAIPLILACHSATIAGESEAGGRPWYQNGSFYTSLSGGVAFFEDSNVDVSANPSGAADFEMETGSAFALGLGYDFGSLRVEGQFSYSQADITSLETNTGAVDVSSQFTQSGFMANGLWDFDFKPFIVSAGAGVGFSKVEYEEMANSGFTAVAESSDTVFSGQLILGLGYQLSENATVGVNCRYLMMSGVDDSGDVDTGLGGESDISFDNLNAGILELFVSWRF